MSKHSSAEQKLGISPQVQPKSSKKIVTHKDNSAPQAPTPGQNAKNQYR